MIRFRKNMSKKMTARHYFFFASSCSSPFWVFHSPLLSMNLWQPINRLLPMKMETTVIGLKFSIPARRQLICKTTLSPMIGIIRANGYSHRFHCHRDNIYWSGHPEKTKQMLNFTPILNWAATANIWVSTHSKAMFWIVFLLAHSGMIFPWPAYQTVRVASV